MADDGYFTPTSKLQEAYTSIEAAQVALEQSRKAVLKLDSIWREYFQSVQKIAAALETKSRNVGK